VRNNKFVMLGLDGVPNAHLLFCTIAKLLNPNPGKEIVLPFELQIAVLTLST
jgi:hypothetical protein